MSAELKIEMRVAWWVRWLIILCFPLAWFGKDLPEWVIEFCANRGMYVRCGSGKWKQVAQFKKK